MSCENLKESAGAIRRHLIGNEDQSGARQAIERAREENESLVGLNETFKAKLKDAARAASALLTAATTSRSELDGARHQVTMALDIAQAVFDSDGAAGIRQQLHVSKTTIESDVDLIHSSTVQELRNKLAPLFQVYDDAGHMLAPGVPDTVFTGQAALIENANAMLTTYEENLG